MARYDYALSAMGRQVADEVASRFPEMYERIAEAARVIVSAGDLNYMELSIAAKAYFALQRLEGKATLKRIEEMLPEFGWKVSADELAKAASFLSKVGVITQSE